MKIAPLSENKGDLGGTGKLKRIYKPQFRVNFAPYVNLKWLESNTSAVSRDFLSGKRFKLRMEINCQVLSLVTTFTNSLISPVT